MPLSEDLNTAAFVQQQRSANDVSAANESNTCRPIFPDSETRC